MGPPSFAPDSPVPFYVPSFIWASWYEKCPTSTVVLPDGGSLPFAGLHLYDTFKGELSTNLNSSPFSHGVFDPIEKMYPEATALSEWKAANAAFRCLEVTAETAIRSILHQVPVHGLRHLDEASSTTAKRRSMSLSVRATKALQKYLIFLRFRNSERFVKVLRSHHISRTFLHSAETRTRYTPLLHSDYSLPDDSFFDWKLLLESFTVFLGDDFSRHRHASFICQCIHPGYDRLSSAELCVGMSLDPDQYILSASCWGAVADNDEVLKGEPFNYFFPIAPNATLYLLMNVMDPLEKPPGSHFLDDSADAPLLIDGDLESALDVYQRNALLLQSQPQYLIFASSRSLERSLKYYNQRSWSPANLDYSKLLRGCREKDVTYTLLTKASIEVLDLTDEVRIIGTHACGFGSFADVWKGIWYDRQKAEIKQNIVAIKMLRAHLNGYAHDKIFNRLRKEVKAWHRLDHPHIARFFGIMQLASSFAMVSPWCDHGDIKRYLSSVNPGADRLQLLLETAQGVAYLHSREPVVIHGDLKSANILVNEKGQAVITDFGLAKVLEEMSEVLEKPSSALNGSLRWMAPELLLSQIEDEQKICITTFTDVYAYASTCLEILTGKLPYSNRTHDRGVLIDIMQGIKPSNCFQFTSDDPGIMKAWRLLDDCWHSIPHARPIMTKLCESLSCIIDK